MAVIVVWPATWTPEQLADASAAIDASIELWQAPLTLDGVRLLVRSPDIGQRYR